jgi:hypothetical protein
MSDLQLRQLIAMIPKGEHFKKTYKAADGGLRLITEDAFGNEKSYVCILADDGTVRFAQR